ncbi:uncharacterized protein LOC124493571 [Dermatophagoides farinae]|uniref:uncharacterized protein LOC124493571 n=1 Tax=Dermatophagoides farinae TaxID=6954 RepID=UPI003F5F1CDB
MNENIDQTLHYIHNILSGFYLSSYSPKYYPSILDFYTHFLLLDYKKCLMLSLPRMEQFRFFLTTIIAIYYMTFSMNIIHYTDTERFLLGDLTIIIIGESDNLIHNSALFAWSALTIGWLLVYDLFHTKRSNAYRTTIIYINERDDDPNFEKKYKKLTKSSILLFNFIHQILPDSNRNFKQFSNRLFCITQIFHFIINLFIHFIRLEDFIHTRPLWQILIRAISIQMMGIVLNFLFSFYYSTLTYSAYILWLGLKTIKNIRKQIDTLLRKYQSNEMATEKILKQSNIFIQLRLLKLFHVYTRIIISTEQIESYASRMMLWAIFFTYITSQFTIHLINELKNDNIIIWISLYYILFLEHVVMFLLSYMISTYNYRLNSIQYDIRRTVIALNQKSSNRFKIKMMIIYYYLVNLKTFGIKIGPITVLNKIIFVKIIIYYARVTMLWQKLFGH